MASIQELINAAYRISEGAKDVRTRSEICGSTLETHASRLAPLVQGSRSGEEAAREVRSAARAVRDCAARMLTLQTRLDEFVRDASK